MLDVALDASNRLVALRWVWIIVVVGAVLTFARVWILRTRVSRSSHPDKYNDQQNYRGMEQGGYYTYRPGMFSHSYPPDKDGQPVEFRRDNPQPGREPKEPWPDDVLYEQTVFKEDIERLKAGQRSDSPR